jgi:hypothetical protein
VADLASAGAGAGVAYVVGIAAGVVVRSGVSRIS